ncbi:MAG: SemiSWEET transporter [Methanophagales archaeon]|jgi:MtN3 and saliva related transmembrane protein|nr:SemiSWEET transporter [Methanophagales archaeon]
MHWITIIGLLAAMCTTIAFLPQVIKTVKTKETKDISRLMYIILTTGILLWVVYGLLTMDLPIILANSITFILALIVLMLKIIHG